MSSAPRSRRRAGGVLVAVVLALTACGGGSSSGESSSGADPADAADRSAEFRFAMSTGFNSLDPHSPISTADSIWQRPLYDRLLTLATTEEGGVELAPQLATDWSVADDGRSIALTLRDDVTFQDGAEFDAEAVRANLEHAQGPDSTVGSQLTSLTEVEVTDATHVVLQLAGPDPALLWALADSTVGMMISPDALDSDLAATPAGSGPYRLVSANKDADVVYERWDDHWNPDAALAARLTISTVSDANARFNGVRSGQYDAGYLAPPGDTASESMVDQGYYRTAAPSPVSYGMLINSSMEPFDDVRVRRAVSLALDREQISAEVLRDLNPPSYQAFNRGYLGFDEDLDTDVYDLEEARALIREAGAEGARVTLNQYTIPPHNTLAQIAQQALTDIGLEVELNPISPTEGLPIWRRGGVQAQVSTIVAFADPAQTLSTTYLGADNPGVKPPELQAMADAARALPVDSAEREQAYQEIGAWLVENPVHVPFAQFTTVVLARPNVVGADRLVVQDIGKLDFRGVGVSGG